MWNRWLVFGKTIYMKILITLLMVLLLVIFLMEVSNFYILKQYRKSAEEMYQNSLEYYSDSWRERMKSISNSLLSLIGSERGKDFENICLSRDNLSIEVSKIALMDKLSEITYLHENEIRLFVCIPDRDIYFTSSNNIDFMR